MLRDKLTEELGFEKWRDVVKAKVSPYRIITVFCSVLDNVIAENKTAAKSFIHETDLPEFDPE